MKHQTNVAQAALFDSKTLFVEAIRPTNYRTEYDDRFDAALLDGCPRGILHLVSGKSTPLNLADESDAVTSLLQENFTLKEIAQLSGVHLSRLESAFAFSQMPAALAAGIRNETIKKGVAQRLVKLAPQELDQLAATYQTNGALTEKDIHHIRHLTITAQTKLLPDSLFPIEPTNHIESIVRDMAKRVSPDEIRDLFEQAMEAVFDQVVR